MPGKFLHQGVKDKGSKHNADRIGQGNVGWTIPIPQFVEVVGEPKQEDEHVVLQKAEVDEVEDIRHSPFVEDLHDIDHVRG